MPTEREIAEIEAVLRRRLRPTRVLSVQHLWIGDYALNSLAAEIAALRSEDREDGAREMRERAARKAAAWSIKHRSASGRSLAPRLEERCYTAESIAAEVRALPLQTPKGDGDA